MKNWPSNFQLLSFQSSNFQFCHFSLLSINFCQCSPPLELSYLFMLSDQNYTVLTFILIIIFIVKRKINKKAIKKKKKKNMSANMSKMANANPEGIDEVRMSWNVWTWMKVEASKCVIPLAASISPIRPHLDIPTLPYAPLRCKTCASVLNPYACVIFATKPVFVFVLDTCMIEEEMGYVKSALRRTVCHWLVARERPCWLRFIWDSDSGSWIGLLRHVQGFDFSGKGNDKVRGTTTFPLLFFFFFFNFNFLLIMKIIIKRKKKGAKVKGSLNGKR